MSSAGTLIDIQAKGAQDVFLTGKPQITFFKSVYKRYSNFAIGFNYNGISENARPGATGCRCQIERNADMLYKCYLDVQMPKLLINGFNGKIGYIKNLGHYIAKRISFQIGGVTVDTHTSDWLHIWHDLTHTNNQDDGYDKLIGNTPEFTTLRTQDEIMNMPEYSHIMVPLSFWFCRNYSVALPLIALQYHESVFTFDFAPIRDLVCYTLDPNDSNINIIDNINNNSFPNIKLLCTNIYLSSEERMRFAQLGHEYLIEQVQNNTIGMRDISENGENVNINFNQPVKELYWTISKNIFHNGNRFLAYTPNDDWKQAIVDASISIVKSSFAGIKLVANLDKSVTYSSAITEYFKNPTNANIANPNTPYSYTKNIYNVSNHSTIEWYTFNNTVNQPVAANEKIPSIAIPANGDTMFTIPLSDNTKYNFSIIGHDYTVFADMIGKYNIKNCTSNIFDTPSSMMVVPPPKKTFTSYIAMLDIVKNPVVIDNKNLMDLINDVVIVLDLGFEAVLNNKWLNVVINKHCMTIKNISKPLDDSNKESVVLHRAKSYNSDVIINNPGNFAMNIDNNGDTITEAEIKFNGSIRSERLPSTFYGKLQPYQYHTHTPKDGIYSFSFALKPEDIIPTGTTNFSRIDKAQLTLYNQRNREDVRGEVNVYALNYNILRISGGMGGVAFAN